VNKFNNFPAIHGLQGTPAAQQAGMWRDGYDVGTRDEQREIFLDGVRVAAPHNRRSLAAVGAWLEALALRQGRVICAFRVDGEPVGPRGASHRAGDFRRIEAETTGLEEMPLQVLATALEQTNRLLAQAEAALAQMCINEGAGARELWWRLAAELKLPLVTLSLLPRTAAEQGKVSPLQLRRWQLEQLAEIIQELDRHADAEQPDALIEALERRLWPWLWRLRETLMLQREAMTAGARLAAVA
jgi:hypothetical protein